MRMAKYIAKRVLLMLFVLFVITTVCFTSYGQKPGSDYCCPLGCFGL